MNWLSAFDIIPLVVILLCAIDALRQLAGHRQPIRAVLLVLIAIGAFHRCTLILHGLNISGWSLVIDVLMAIWFGAEIRSMNFSKPMRNLTSQRR